MFKQLQRACCGSLEMEDNVAESSATVRSQGEQPEENGGAMQINREVAAVWKPSENHKSLPFAKYDQNRRFHAVKESPYVLPADVNEQERLVLQHKLLIYGFGKLFHMPIEEQLKEGNFKVLDSGCGPGAWSRQVAKTYPKSTVIASDMARTVLIDAEWDETENLSFVEGNVLSKLPFASNSFDAVFQRMLVLGIPKNKWVDVIKELIRITKPGGYIELIENVIPFQMGPTYAKLYNSFCDSTAERGLDLDAGLNIKKYMEEAGLEVIEEASISAPFGWDGRFGELMTVNMKTGFGAMKPFLSKVLSLSDEDYDKMVEKALEECPKYQTYMNFYAFVGKVSK